ncbi:MAG: MoaD/ThiS family protein [Rhodocyclaceae bacterium]|nr:MoaD/ThiS family protein [Rhodocyclaceae bacterium]
MATVIVRIPTPLRPFAAGRAELEAEGATAAEVLACLGQIYPDMLARVLDADGAPRAFVNIFVGRDRLRDKAALAAPLPPASVISIVPAVAGGHDGRQRSPAG